MKSAFTTICTLLWLATAAGGAQLTSVQSSYHAYGNFAILVLRFDDKVSHELQTTAGGTAVLISIPGCKLTPAAAAELAATHNTLQKSVQTSASDSGLILRLEFTQAMKTRLSEANNPPSIILDISPATRSNPGSKTDSINPSRASAKPPQGSIKNAAAPPSSQTKPGNAGYYLAQGKQALAAKQERAALDDFEKALKLQPANAEANYLLGVLQLKWGQQEAAIAHFQKAKADSAFLPQAATELASIYHQMGRTADEVSEWEAFFSSMKKAQSLPESLSDVEEQSTTEADTITKPPVTETLAKPASKTVVAPPSDSLKSAALIKPANTKSTMEYFVYAVVALLIAVVVLLYVRQRDIQETLTLLLATGDNSDYEPSPPPSANASPADRSGLPPPSASHEPRGAEDTAREVLGLYKAGMSIPGIAEKLSIGQDEVKLILNLQREEARV